MRNLEFKLGQGVSFLFVSLTPIVTLVLDLLVAVPIAGRIGIGGHEWYVIVGVLATTLFIHSLNLPLIVRRLGGARMGKSDE